MSITPITTNIYDIHSVLALCENEDFTEHFHNALQDSDYSFGNNGDTLVGARDFANYFHETLADSADCFSEDSINLEAINAFLDRMIAEDDKIPTFVGLGC